MNAEDIKGLTPKQIQDKFALPSTPKYVTDVTVPKGTTMRTGTVNPVYSFSSVENGMITQEVLG